MADLDWTSLAASLIPAALGGAIGGGRGAAFGLASGAGNIAQNHLLTEKANKDIEFQNREQSMQQQRMDQQRELEEKRIAIADRNATAEEKRWDRLEREAEQNMLFRQKQMEKFDIEIGEATRTREGLTSFRNTLPEKERPLFDADPKDYIDSHRKKKDLELQMTGAGAMLERYGIKGGKDLAMSLGPAGTGSFLESLMRSKSENKPFAQFDQDRGVFYFGDARNPASIKTVKVGDAKTKDVTMQEANTIRDNARQTVESQFKGPMGQIDMSALGKTPQERLTKFEGMVSATANKMAADQGRPDLFRQADPIVGLTSGLNNGSIKSTSDAVAFLLNRGVPPDKVNDTAKEIIGKVKGAALRQESDSRTKAKDAR